MAKKDNPQPIENIWQRYWIYLIPLILCSLVMLPRLLDPQFGLMDDGDAFQKANLISAGQWGAGSEAAAGRFRPLYWYIHYILFLLFGVNPNGFFFVNYLFFALLIVGVVKLLKDYGSTKAMILLASTLFILSGPISESYYTLSKYEIFQLVFIVYAMLMSKRFTVTRSMLERILLGVGIVLFSLVSYLIKETSLIMPAIYTGWLAIFAIKHWKEKRRLSPLVVMLIGSLAAGAAFLIWRSYYFTQVISAGTYVGTHISLSISQLVNSLIEWEPWLRRDFSYSADLVFFALLSFALMKRKSLQAHIVWGASIWMIGWLGVFLPWVIKIEYYLLPFALGCSVLSAQILVDLLENIRMGSTWKRLAIYIIIGVAGILFINSLLLIINNARYQLLMDNINARMMNYLVEIVPEDGHVFVNLPADSEYIKEIQLQFEYIYTRPDIDVARFYYQISKTKDNDSFVISPIVVNRPTYSVRHAFNENDSVAWSYSLDKYMTDGIAEPVTISAQFTQIEPHIFRIICPILRNLGSCESTSQILESKQLSYQWEIYQYSRQLETTAQPGVYNCGLWRLRQMGGTEVMYRFGECDDTPIVGDWNGDSTSDLGVYNPTKNEWRVDWDYDGHPDLIFILEGMVPGDTPLVGDWDGDSRDTPGYFNSTSQNWILFEGQTDSYQVVRSIRGGIAISVPLVGDWNRDSLDTWGIYSPETGDINLENEFLGDLAGVDYQLPVNSFVIVADWYGTGRDTLAFIDKTDWVILPSNCGCSFPNYPPPYRYPIENGIPVSGFWP
jgi:hypothetical protein